ncbi:guanine nucleotide binding protein, alpha subunit [Pisolithus croceorrhizus]|nr:guanine nucleotide binding protein, alpha subunit [Pisolithus croceorrhizus]
MGNCASSAQEKADRAKSAAIDRQIEEDAKKFRKECKILLLGAGESGKSTIVKQMKIIHQNGFTNEELMTYRPTIYRNTLDSAQAIVLAMRKINVDCVNPLNRENVDKILDYRVDASPSFVFSSDIAKAIHDLWQDPDYIYRPRPQHFFGEVLRIGTPNYLPTVDDVLRARAKSTGITETHFTMGQLSIHMFDVGGQRSERKKWIHCFESVTSIIFCTALSEYDQVLLEAKEQNRMVESLLLFESVINSRWFLRTSIILFLNKIDVFKVKLPKVPLEHYFPEYTGGSDINKAAKYILWRFMQANRARLSVYPHLTQATDTSNIRLVFAAVKETILRNALKDSGIL